MRWRSLFDTVGPQTSAVLLLLLVGWTWLARIPYPFDLEWMEGGMLAHAWRLDQGLPLYAAPSPEFVPYIYPPGYSAVVALLGKVFGLSLPLGRVVSVVGTVAAAGSIGFVVRRVGGTPLVALCAAAVFLGTYPQSGAFYDLVRPDGLCLGLLGWSIALVWVRARWAPVAAALLLVAAFLVKHNAAAFGIPLVLGFGWRHGWRAAGAFAVAAIVPAAVAVGLLQWRSDGWFLRYLVEVPASHPVPLDRMYVATPREWGTPLPVAFGAIAAAALWYGTERSGPIPRPVAAFAPVVVGMWVGAVLTYIPPPPESGQYNVPSAFAFFAIGAVPVALGMRAAGWVADRRAPSRQLVFYLALGLTAGVFAAWMRAHAGGFLNVHVPMFYVVALGFGLVCTWAMQRWPTDAMKTAVGAVMTAQLVWSIALFGRPKLVPTRQDYAAGEQMVAAVKAIDGEVLSPFAAWLPVYAGKPPSLHYQGLWDLELSEGPIRQEIRVVQQAVRQKRWDAVLAGNQKFPYALSESYQVDKTVLDPKGRGLMPKTGYKARPERILVPKP
jgi:hypothetical protein